MFCHLVDLFGYISYYFRDIARFGRARGDAVKKAEIERERREKEETKEGRKREKNWAAECCPKCI